MTAKTALRQSNRGGCDDWRHFEDEEQPK